MLYSQYLRENHGTTGHCGHPADCQLALTNAPGRHKTLRLRPRVLWWPEALVPFISHIMASHIKIYIMDLNMMFFVALGTHSMQYEPQYTVPVAVRTLKSLWDINVDMNTMSYVTLWTYPCLWYISVKPNVLFLWHWWLCSSYCIPMWTWIQCLFWNWGRFGVYGRSLWT